MTIGGPIPRARMAGDGVPTAKAPTQNPARRIATMRSTARGIVEFTVGLNLHSLVLPLARMDQPFQRHMPNHQWLLKVVQSKCGKGVRGTNGTLAVQRSKDGSFRMSVKTKRIPEGRKPISRSALEQILAESVRTSDPECEAFIGVLVERFVPVLKGGPNWVVKGVRY